MRIANTTEVTLSGTTCKVGDLFDVLTGHKRDETIRFYFYKADSRDPRESDQLSFKIGSRLRLYGNRIVRKNGRDLKVASQNQWGQEFNVGDIVGYSSKTGSFTTRKIGTVIGLVDVKISSYPERFIPGARIDWAWDGSYCDRGTPPTPSRDKPSTVRLNNLFKIHHWTLSDDLTNSVGGLA